MFTRLTAATPRFGWSEKGHQEIAACVPGLLRTPQLQKKFQSPRFVAQVTDWMQEADRNPSLNGMRHGVHLDETAAFKAKRLSVTADKSQLSHHARLTHLHGKSFIYKKPQERWGEQLDEIDFNALTQQLANAQGIDNLISMTNKVYLGLVAALIQKDPLLIPTYTGLLIHLASDLCQPQHLSRAHSWPLEVGNVKVLNDQGQKVQVRELDPKAGDSHHTFERLSEGQVRSERAHYFEPARARNWLEGVAEALYYNYCAFLELYVVAGRNFEASDPHFGAKCPYNQFVEKATPIARDQINMAPGFVAWLLDNAYADAKAYKGKVEAFVQEHPQAVALNKVIQHAKPYKQALTLAQKAVSSQPSSDTVPVKSHGWQA